MFAPWILGENDEAAPLLISPEWPNPAYAKYKVVVRADKVRETALKSIQASLELPTVLNI